METFLENNFWIIPVLAWFGIFTIIGQFSGWKKFAELYTGRDISLQSKEKFRWQSLKLGNAKYNNAVTIQTTIEGLQLSMPWVFRINHPPIFIPWTDITNISIQKIFFSEITEISLQQSTKKIILHNNIFKNNQTVPYYITEKFLSNRTQ